ncbi:class I SAM-dependent methyltransferase [Cylindrospermopsis raciborskii]|uniref:class I SAM-dependent methyltransferase n=1 Tax=Cylindrospermopsis raciborskii TaxID=77022 RepID=UPI0008DE4BF2|nr:class I SAM-dependent methyltransferase [Cylindrospermopsis raciborskii]NLQ06417.1 class I SAM-dependent methyltransferase [Cylindrospermopsis raciborskii MVCC19]OHY34134.1 2-polyprenyl-3-methyl-5-hydroxy-6-metoxy-1,4-benzoquinol methylase [Cylindrospermopsis raciborskii MVCC14]
MGKDNIDLEVVEGFGNEWSRFDYSNLSDTELQEMFSDYFRIFPWEKLAGDAVGFDLGCGSGRWAKLVAPNVGKLHLIDPSTKALNVARKNLAGFQNCVFHLAGVDEIPLENESADFGYSLGVLHHIPDTQSGIRACVMKLKKNAPFLIYLYYSFDNRPWWYRKVWKTTEIARSFISDLPNAPKYWLSQIIALLVYWPMSRLSLLLEKIGVDVKLIPLSAYRHRTFYVLRNDALDRFGTRLEKRFSRLEIQTMLENSGLEKISFSNSSPYWCALGYKQ